jgi:chlorobactene glucosyltransferase
MTPLVEHQYSLVAFLTVLLAISIGNLFALHRLGHHPGKRSNRSHRAPLPRASVLVPARNEERNIAACVRSLLAQDYPEFEVIVLDDASDDGTRDALCEFAEDERLWVLPGQALPTGWLGKNWACHQLAGVASGEVLLFTDADTRHHRSALRDAVSALFTERVDFLSVLARQELGTWGERLIVPLLTWSLHSFFPVGLVRRLRMPELATAFGQFMLFRRAAYDAVGGHERVRASVIEDWDIVRNIVGAGTRWTVLDGAERVSARMYHSFREALDGFSKNLFARFGHNLPVLLFVWSWTFWVTWEPPAVLVLRALGFSGISDATLAPAAAATGLGLLLWVLSDVRFRIPVEQAFLHPATILLALLIAVRSVIWHYAGAGTWKGRSLRPPGEQASR